jgi:outer membrane protein TolC
MALLAAALFASSAARAEERSLTLNEAFKIAEKQNLDLSSARSRLDQASLQVKQAFAALYPTAALQGKYTHNYKEVTLQLGPERTATVQQGEQLDGMLNISAPLFNPAVYPGLKAAKESEALSKDTFTLAKTQVLFGVAQAFYAAAGTEELVAARKHAVEVANQTLEQAKTRFQSGNATRLDVSRAELAVVQAEKAADEAADAKAQAYRGLSTLLQLRDPFHVVSGEIAPVSTTETGERPEVKVLERSIALADLQKQVARNRWFPSLSAFGTARLSNYAGFTGDKYFWAAGLQLDWVAFDGGVRDVQAKIAESQRIEAESKLLLQRDTIADEVANTQQAVATKTRSVTAAQRSVELSREALELVRIRYEAGQATQLDVLQGQDSLVMAEVGLAQARFDLALANLAAQRASGSFLEKATQVATK